MVELRAVLMEMITQCLPCVALLVYANVVLHRWQVDCYNECQRVHDELRRLARKMEDDESPPEPKPEPKLPVVVDVEEPPQLPVARIYRR